ncbi:unnamed protein product [Acanthoscelides obtectus]|uniref:Uncharacterized protein n=1 Tax=Acanthoscelides obtectus TaxID=200917 RepID=A0A9P0MEA9_ACAOB|nr:unnamed protein product [Acanthoscelides obtectus]CAK1680386.1 hypothetical protein AOBTE_LOCUS32612 [Acanthoscelides obtectus]
MAVMVSSIIPSISMYTTCNRLAVMASIGKKQLAK